MLTSDNFRSLMVDSYGELLPIDINVYSDNTPLIKLPDNYQRNGINCNAIDIYARPTFMSDLVGTLAFAEYLKRQHGIRNLYLPYVPGARQDRDMGSGGDVLFMAKYVTNLINSVGFSNVFVLDPHSNVTPALINNCVSYYYLPDFNDILPKLEIEFSGVVAPDGSAEKRALAFAKKYQIPLYHGWKTRNTKTGEIDGVGCEDLPDGDGKRLLVVDDICDGGKTFIELGKLLRNKNYVLTLFVTHGIFSKGINDLSTIYSRIVTTNSLTRTQSLLNNRYVTVCDCFRKFCWSKY